MHDAFLRLGLTPALLATGAVAAEALADGQWPSERAAAWYAAQPWPVGCNYLPRTAVNDVEMWQAETFDDVTIDQELGWAHDLGLNSLRVFLNAVVWQHDPAGLQARLGRFLEIAHRHGLSVMPVLLDDCNFGNREARVGRQEEPVPGVHNSGWVSSPPLRQVTEPTAWPELERYVRALVRAFGHDPRIIAWDLYNEPGNSGLGDRSLPLAEAVFAWARREPHDQPLTIGPWHDFASPMSRRLFELSDVISFHGYDTLPGIEARLATCRAYGRPILCTEWLHRQSGNTLHAILPAFRAARVGAWNWGLVAGRTQTFMPWGSKPGTPIPAVWQHDWLHADGRPFDESEVRELRSLTAPVP